MDHPTLVIRPAREGDAAAVAAVYAPYVLDTAVSFETEAPTAATMAQRIGETLATHPWLVADRNGEVVGYAYAGKHSQRAVSLDGQRDGVCARPGAPQWDRA